MINAQEVKPGMPVVCSKDGQFAEVDHIDGAGSIKLRRDKSGKHHLIPLSWVAKVHDHIHLSKDHAEVESQWQPA